MASTITSSSLKVKISEEIELNGKSQGGEIEHTVSTNINEIYKRRMTITDTEVAIINTGTVAGGTFPAADIRYMRISNLSSSTASHIILRLIDGSTTSETALKLVAGASILFYGDTTTTAAAQGVLKYFDAEDGAISTIALGDILQIKADCSTSAGQDIEIFIASV